MKKFLLTIFALSIITQPSFAWSWFQCDTDEYAVKKLLKSQIKYANNTNFEKFIKTYDPKYTNSDGFNLDVYSNLIKDIWNTYDNIKYGIDISKISIQGNKATVDLIETSYAKLKMNDAYDGELKSNANTIYYLEKKNGAWKVVSDKVVNETTTMLYGDAKDLEINLTVPQEIEANKAQYRQGLIDLGNWGRAQSPDYWLEKIIAQEGNIVVTDVRIKHEYEVFKKAGAITLRVEADREIRESRGGKLIGENDVTEVDLDNIQDWDFVIDNNKDYETLRKNVLKIVERLR